MPTFGSGIFGSAPFGGVAGAVMSRGVFRGESQALHAARRLFRGSNDHPVTSRNVFDSKSAVGFPSPNVFRGKSAVGFGSRAVFRGEALPNMPCRNVFRAASQIEVGARDVFRTTARQIVPARRTFEARAGQVFSARSVFRAETQAKAGFRNVFRASNRIIMSRNPFRAATRTQVVARNAFQAIALPAPAPPPPAPPAPPLPMPPRGGLYVGGGSESGANLNSTGYTATASAVYQGSIMVIPRAVHCRITLNESQASTWELGVVDEDGQIVPTQSGEWAGVMDKFPYDTYAHAQIGQYDRQFLLGVVNNGVSYEFDGVPDRTKTSGSRPDQRTKFSWGGTDQSHSLYGQEKTLPTIRSVLGATNYSNDLIREMLASVGLTYYCPTVENYPIPYMHRQGESLIEYIQWLLEIVCAEWSMVGNGFSAWVPNPSTYAATVDFQRDVIDSYECDDSVSNGFVDKVIVTRSPENGGIPKTVTCQKWGQQTVTFDTVVNNVTWRATQQTNGVFSDFIAYDAGGGIVGAADPRMTGAGSNSLTVFGSFSNVKSIKFTWGQPTPSASSSPAQQSSAFGSITFFGRTQNNDPQFGGPNDTLETLQAWYGLGAYPRELKANELIPTGARLQTYATRMLGKLGRQATGSKVVLPLNTLLKPGISVQEVNRKNGLSRNVYLTQAVHEFDPFRKNRKTTYTGCVYPDLSQVTYKLGAPVNPYPQAYGS